MQDEIQVIELKFNNNNLILRDHKVYNISVVPGVTFLDVLYRCLNEKKIELTTVAIEEMLFNLPLATASGIDRKVQIELNLTRQIFRISSLRFYNNQPASDEWILHAEGKFHQKQALMTKKLNVTLLKQQAIRQFSLENIYDFAKQKDIVHGPFMQAEGEVYVGDNYVFAKLWLSDIAEGYLNKFYLHPALLDGSTLLGFAPFYKQQEVNKLPIPFYIRSFQSLGSLPSPCFVYVTNKPNQDVKNDTFETTLEYYDKQGRLIAVVEGLVAKQIRNPEQITALIEASVNLSIKDNIDLIHMDRVAVKNDSELPKDQIAKDIIDIIKQQFNKSIALPDQYQDFYSLGLDSIQLVQLVRELEKRIGKSLYPTLLFEYRSIDKLAQFFVEQYGEDYLLNLSNQTAELSSQTINSKQDEEAVKNFALNNTLNYYYSTWLPAELKSHTSNINNQGAWGLFIIPNENFSTELEKNLASLGHSNVIRVLSGKKYKWINDRQLIIDITNPDHHKRLWQELKQRQQLPEYIVHALASMFDLSSACTLEYYLTNGIFSLRLFVQTYLEQIGHKKLLILFTYEGGRAQHPYLACVAGWLRSLKLELGAWSGKVLSWTPELNTNFGSREWLTQIYAELAEMKYAEVVKEINYLDKQRYSKTFKPDNESNLFNQEKITLQTDEVYLLTGGLGGIGVLLAKDLLAHHKIKLVLTGRSQLTSSQLTQLQSSNKSGSQIIYLSADLSKQEDVKYLLNEIKNQCGQIKGIIHAAGLLKDSLIINQSLAELEMVLAAKLAGTLNLDDLTQNYPLDFFICFSSISAEFGNIGQSAYALANSFLDNFAVWRNEQRELGKRAGHTISVNWPLWADGGMQTNKDVQENLYQQYGMAPLPTSLGLQAFYHTLASACSQIMVVYGNTEKLAKILSKKVAEQSNNLDYVLPETKILKCSSQQSPQQLLLSITQQQLYAIYLQDKHSVAYNIGVALEVDGKLNFPLLTRALTEIVAQHEVLRMAIVHQADKPIAFIHPTIEFELPVISMRGVPKKESKEKLQALFQTIRKQNFELDKSPLWRLCLVCLSETNYVLVVIFHHIIMDGWSLVLFIKKLFDNYHLLEQGQAINSKPIAYQYADYIAWQQQQLEESRLALTLNFWQQQFNIMPEPLVLPFTKPRSTLTNNIQQITFALSTELTQQINSISQQQGVTLFAFFLSAYQVFLARYANQQAIVVGVPFLGRDSYPMQETIGIFINILPLIIHLADDLTFNAMLHANQDKIEQSRKHQYLPLNQLLNALQVKRSLNTQPLFQVLFNQITITQPQLETPHLQAKFIWEETGRPAYDLNCEIQTNAEGIKVCLKYNAALFELSTIEQMARHFNYLLTQLVADPTKLITAYDLLDQNERDKILVNWNQTDINFPAYKTINVLLENQAKISPNNIALIFNEQSLTYQTLNIKANQLAHYLIQQGITAETIVAVNLERSLELIITLVAILKAGGAYLPLDHANPPERLAFMLEDSQANYLITHTQFQNKFPSFQGKWLFIDQLQTIFADNKNQTNPEKFIKPKQLAYVIYTSGSTGQPKGVMVEHHSVVNCLYAIQNHAQIEANSIFLAVTSLSFDVAALDYFLPFAIGATSVIASQTAVKDPKQLLDLFTRYQPTVMQATPALWRMLINSDWKAHAGFKVLTAGEALAKDLAAALITQCQVFNIYGPTEATIYATFAPIKAADQITIGKPIANLKTYILNSKMQPVPIGVPGELYLGGVGVARGYLNRPTLTQERFIANPFITAQEKKQAQNETLYRTGDLTYYLPDGNIVYLGRIDNQVKLRGYRIELDEIEHKLNQLPRVKQAVVILYEDETKAKQLIAFILKQPDVTSLTEKELRLGAENWLPEYMVPSRFIILPQLPISPNGKIDRKALELLATQQLAKRLKSDLASKTQINLQGQILHDITEVVSNIVQLQPEVIQLNHALGEYGFDSLRFGELSIKLTRKFSIDITPTLFYRYSTISEISEYLLKTFPQQIQQAYPSVSGPLIDQANHTVANNNLNINKFKQPNDRNKQEIAVIGIACRLPQSPTVDSFWQNLVEGKDLITEIPPQRWDWQDYATCSGTKWGGFIENADHFDAGFFNISPHEAQLMDPQQRLLLELVWEAIENAGYKPSELSGTKTGVYIGSTGTEYGLMQQAAGIAMDTHSISGNAQAIAANRISFVFNFNGPSASIDTACSSSLVAIHRAVAALKAGECDTAIVAGVNLLLSPNLAYQGLSKMGMLSPEGRCKTFDESADGYVRSEGVVVLILKPLSQAQDDSDIIHALIKGSAENHGGKTHGLTIPNPEAQSQLITTAYKTAEIDPSTITYIEAHGTGTRLGDPIEIDGLKQAFANLYEDWHKPEAALAHCGIGSVKSNVGHLEGAAGITGLLKVILAMQHKILPASLHIKQPNKVINLASSPFYLIQQTRPWDALQDKQAKIIPRRAGVSSFGFGGSNVHVVVEEAPELQTKQDIAKPYYLITISGKSEQVLRQRINDLAAWLETESLTSLSSIAFTLNAKREHFHYRCALVVNSKQDLVETLQQLNAGEHPSHCLFSAKEYAKKYEPIFTELLVKLFEDIKDFQQVSPITYQQKLLALADLYTKGFNLDWNLLHQNEAKQRISLPTYPFQRKRFWFEQKTTDASKQPTSPSSTHATLSYYRPVWEEKISLSTSNNQLANNILCVFSDNEKLIQAMRDNMPDSRVIHVRSGNTYLCIDELTYQVRLSAMQDYEELLVALTENEAEINNFIMARYFMMRNSEPMLQTVVHEHFNLTHVLSKQRQAKPLDMLSLYHYDNEHLTFEQMLVGFAKSINLETTHYRMRMLGIDVGKDISTVTNLLRNEISQLNSPFTHVRYHKSVRQAESYELQQTITSTAMSATLRKQGVYLITGGMGGLGFLLAQYLAKTYQAKLILTGRSSLEASKRAKLQQLTALGATAYYLEGDVTDETCVQTWLNFTKQHFGVVHGVIHCAGYLQDSLILNKKWNTFKEVLAAKVQGTLQLDKVTQAEKLECFILFSSLSSCIGNIGQTDYASANAFLNVFANWRHGQTDSGQRHGKTIAINWPYWLEGGMRLNDLWLEQQRKLGLQPLTTTVGWQALEQCLRQTAPVTTVLYGEQVEFDQLLAAEKVFKSAEEKSINKIASSDNNSLTIKLEQDLILLTAATLKISPTEISKDELLSEYGFDSILLTSLAQSINKRYALSLTPAHFYTFSTVAELAKFLLQSFAKELNSYWQNITSPSIINVASSQAKVKSSINFNPVLQPNFALEDIAIIGMSCLLPDAENSSEFWQNLLDNKTSYKSLPSARKADWLKVIKNLNLKLSLDDIQAAFIDEVANFDAKFFKIVPREAQLLDPQQRLLLQETWHCLEHAGYNPKQLRDSDIGVFVGAQATDYRDLIQHIIDAKVVTGTLRSMLANRISYQLGFTGPSETVDASCASSLVAIQRAVRALQTGDCHMAIAAGVSLLLSPRTFMAARELGLLAKDGKCHSFGAGGTGFVKGEGLGVLLLKKRSQAEVDGDTIYGLIKGIATNHNGYSHTISSPNGLRQADVMLTAYQQAQIDPATIGYIEAQATGSETTDAVEFDAFKRVWQQSQLEHTSCYLGSVKPNIGHLESASGIISVIKVLLAMQHKIIPGLNAFKHLNPQIQLADTPFKFSHQPKRWETITDAQGHPLPRRAAIHNYAAGGLNAHLILEEHNGPKIKWRKPLPAYRFAKTDYWHSDIVSNSLYIPDNPHHKSVHEYAQQVAQLIAMELGLRLEELQFDISLFEQGVDSILLAQVLAKIEQVFACDLSTYTNVLLENPSVNFIAKYLNQANKTIEETKIARVVVEDEQIIEL